MPRLGWERGNECAFGKMGNGGREDRLFGQLRVLILIPIFIDFPSYLAAKKQGSKSLEFWR